MCKLLNIDKQAEILQDTFKHYYSMAMDHHTKARTTSNMLLSIVGRSGGLAVLVIGLFGAVWVLKQYERYRFWKHVAYEYQNELKKNMPSLNMGQSYFGEATKLTAEGFGDAFARMSDRYLWVILHSIVALIGLVVMLISL